MKALHSILMTALICAVQSNAVTFVYNMRIAQITRQQLALGNKRLHILGDTLIGQWLQLKNDFHQDAYGSLVTYIRTTPSTYFKIDGALGHVKNNVITNTFTRTQTDDLLFTGGYGHAVGPHTRIACSALLGVPTHRDFILDLAQFGTGHVGTGLQLDGSHAYNADRTQTLFAAARWIHFFPRNVTSKNPCLRPLYPCPEYRLAIGNLVDLYVSHQITWRKANRFEFGYDASFIGIGSRLCPQIPNFAGSQLYIRNTFFAAYSRLITCKRVKIGFITGLSGAFDSRPQTFGVRRMITAWFTAGVLM